MRIYSIPALNKTLETMGFTWSIKSYFVNYKANYEVIKANKSPVIIFWD